MENIAILVPCYNEEDTIPEVGSELRKMRFPYLIINDGSSDKTISLLHTNNLIHRDLKSNMGKGFAIKYGATELINNNYDYILVMDADGQNDMGDISQFTKALQTYPNAKIIIGNRLCSPNKMPLIRYLTNKIMSYIISKLAKIKIPDTQCGMRLIHKDVILNINTKSNRFEYESEQLIKAGRKGYKIVSVPISCIYKKGRESKINPLPDIIRFIKMIIRVK